MTKQDYKIGDTVRVTYKSKYVTGIITSISEDIFVIKTTVNDKNIQLWRFWNQIRIPGKYYKPETYTELWHRMFG